MDDILELDSIYENVYDYYINDYIIFEGILRRDFLEVNGILTEASTKNFLKNIWERILKAFKWLKDRIKELIDKIFKRNKEEDNSDSDDSKEETIREMVKKLNRHNDKDKLKDLKVSGFRARSKIDNDCLRDFIKDYDSYIFFIGPSLFVAEGTPRISKYKHIISDKKKEIDNILNKDISNDLKQFKQDLYNSFFKNNDIEYPFKNNKINFDYCFARYYPTYRDNKLTEFKKDIEKYEKEINNFLEKVNTGNAIPDDDLFASDEKNQQNYEKDVQYVQKGFADMLQALQISSRALIGAYSCQFKCEKMARKQYIKLLKTAINYLEGNNQSSSNESADIDYINALSEATIYELY